MMVVECNSLLFSLDSALEDQLRVPWVSDLHPSSSRSHSTAILTTNIFDKILILINKLWKWLI